MSDSQAGVQPAGMNNKTAPAPWRELLPNRGYWQWLVTAQLVWLPSLMAAFGLVLAGSYATGSIAIGGLMVSTHVLSATLTSPFTGRLLDRIGPARGTPWLMLAATVALSGLAAAVILKSSAPALLVLSGLAGVATSGTSAAMRTILSQVVTQRLLTPALAINSTAIEITVVSAPLLVAVAAIFAPPGAVVAMATAAAIGALSVRRLRRFINPTTSVGTTAAPAGVGAVDLWKNRRFIFWLLVSVAFGHALGTAETGALPLSEHLGGGTGEAALLIAALALSSALSGVAYAALSHRISISPVALSCGFMGLMVVACIAIGLADGWATVAAAMALLGLCTAPLNTVRSVAAEDDVPAHRKAEAFGTLFAANGVGFALGGLLLALLPLNWMLLSGGASAAAAVALAPFLGLRR